MRRVSDAGLGNGGGCCGQAAGCAMKPDRVTMRGSALTGARTQRPAQDRPEAPCGRFRGPVWAALPFCKEDPRECLLRKARLDMRGPFSGGRGDARTLAKRQ